MRAPREGDAITPSLKLVRQLGAGGMGQVWIAWHEGLRCQVVVKLITDQLATSAEAVSRFSREASAASQVRSPHVVQVFDHGVTAAGQPYIAMEFLDGESLRERLDRERVLPSADVVTIVTQCCKALTRAHERGVVHRDIKPDNVFLTDGGGGEIFVKLLDFGIAKSNDGNFVATNTGAVLGSPYYMSPEQVVGSRSIDHRSDLWSLGVMTIEALTGRRPFEGETIGALSIAICHGELPAPSRTAPGLPPELDAWFARACARDVGARFSSAKELSDALSTALADRSVLALPHTTDALAATARLSTTAGVGLKLTPASQQPGWHKWALVGGVVALGALGGITAWSFRSSTVAPPQPAGSLVLDSPSPKPSTTASKVPEAAAAISVSASSLPSASSPSAKLTAAPAPVKKPIPSATPTQSAPVAPPASTPTSPPKVDHDPNLF